jgi:hypothetical protein
MDRRATLGHYVVMQNMLSYVPVTWRSSSDLRTKSGAGGDYKMSCSFSGRIALSISRCLSWSNCHLSYTINQKLFSMVLRYILWSSILSVACNALPFGNINSTRDEQALPQVGVRFSYIWKHVTWHWKMSRSTFVRISTSAEDALMHVGPRVLVWT